MRASRRKRAQPLAHSQHILRKSGIASLQAALKDERWQAVVMLVEVLQLMPVPSRLLDILRESKEAYATTATMYEEKTSEIWIERLQWLLSTSGFGFYSPLTCEQAGRAQAYLAGCVGQDVAE